MSTLRIVTDRGPEDPYLTYADVAKRWGCSKATVRRRVQAGRLDTVFTGQLLRIPIESVLRYEDEERNRRRAS